MQTFENDGHPEAKGAKEEAAGDRRSARHRMKATLGSLTNRV
jgi:hypothetical protein